MRKKECFTSLQPCDRQSEQNDADEPPSLFMPIDAGTGLNRPFQALSSPALINMDLPVFFLSINRFFEQTKTLPFPANRFKRELPESADVFFETEGFILRDKRGRIKTIIFKQKRSM